ncbi:uncharacterized protein RHOBADRAFT_44552 [Rhodotorula graminis WP1]|uniref:Mid2 domain-containing protein n=1 Tax=Rhodotorula graminis (strain WP1) TaxID=578459 RepID=A0A194S2T0_RHOGW|nr:uncharacterized protein RHOBADRAFT_44552 [Rhodotorula graminis WP1]KPV75038.1 hypothetical protein RHOBADRAFT_44552 [Rhodotorula graminis WP1]
MRLAAAQLACAFASLVAVLAQSSTTSDSSSASLATTITGGGTVVSTSAATTSAASSTSVDIPRPTANLTSGANQDLRLWPPVGGLKMCERVTFAFTGPSVPKTCGVYVSNTSTYIQQIPLGGAYTSLTAGEFGWLVDLPAGLSVVVQFCQNTQSIISYASALNTSYVYTPPSAMSDSKSSSANVGAIAGGTIGGVALLLAALLGVYLLRTRHRARTASPPPPDGEDKAWEPGTGSLSYAQLVAMNYAGQGHGQGLGTAQVEPYQSHHLQQPSAFAAEPMPATPAPTTPSRTPLSPGGTTEFGAAPSAGTGKGSATTGLANPASFASRSQRG